MNPSRLFLGAVLLVLNLFIAVVLPSYLSSLPTNQIELGQLVYLLLGIAGLFAGVFEK